MCAGDGLDGESVLALVSGLVNKSLVLAEEHDGQTRYRFMVTLQEYARKQLIRTEEGMLVHRAHADFVLALAIDSDAKLVGTEQKRSFDRLNAEYNDIRGALTWTSSHDIGKALLLAAVLGRFWYLRGHWDEARSWLTAVLEAPGALSQSASYGGAQRRSPDRREPGTTASRTLAMEALGLYRESGNKRETAMALNCLAVLAGKQDYFNDARSLLEQSLTIRRESGDKALTAMTLSNLGLLAFRGGDIAAARSIFEESLSISREVDHKHGIAISLLNLGDVARRVGDQATARDLVSEALALGKDLGDNALIPIALNSLGDLAGRRGDHAAARALLREGLEVSRQSGDKRLTADLLKSFGLVAEDAAGARAAFAESLAMHRELGGRREIAMALSCLGGVAAREGQYALARSLHNEGHALSQQSTAKDAGAHALTGLADVARLQGDHQLAFSLYRQSLTMWRELEEKPEFLRPLEDLATLWRARGRPDRAVCLWAAAQACREVLGIPRAEVDVSDYEREVRTSRAALGEGRFAATWAQGHAMNAAEAVEYALQDESGAGTSGPI